ncbi:MAG: hypothetical protein OXH96_16510 [Spirochaetaceae bacterium]|nr:hypothetical protein [Spirochaetaceae bacterium]
MKRVILVLALAALAVFAFAGGDGEGAAGEGPALNPPGTYPVVNEPYSFTAVAYYSSSTSTGNPDDVWFADYIADLTGIRVDFLEMIEANNAQERFNLILASGDLPELLIPHGTLTAQQVFTHGRNGTFLALNDLIDARMPEYKQRLEEEPEVADRLTMPDGNIYSTVDLEANCFHCQYSVKMWLYKPWVDKLGLDWPETTEDFYNVLKAFKEQDPNGNGKADEVPLIGATTSWRTDPFGFLMNSFVYTVMPQHLNNYGSFLERDGDKVRFVADTPEWREGLKYMHRLASEGLLAEETFVWRREETRQLVENPDAEMVGAYPSGWFGVLTINGAGTGRFAGFKAVAPLTGPDGTKQASFFPFSMRYQAEITNQARHPQVIAQYLDYFHQSDPEVQQIVGGRREGIEWRYLTPEELQMGLVGRDGTPATMKNLKALPFGTELHETGWPRTAPGRWSRYAYSALDPEWADDPSKQEYHLMVWTRDLMQPYRVEKHMTPDLVFEGAVEDELVDLQELITSATGLVMQRSTQFVLGELDIHSDADWNNYVAELERAGAKRYEEIWQETLLANM